MSGIINRFSGTKGRKSEALDGGLDLRREARKMRLRAIGNLVSHAIEVSHNPLGTYIVPRAIGQPRCMEQVAKEVEELEFAIGLEGSLSKEYLPPANTTTPID